MELWREEAMQWMGRGGQSQAWRRRRRRQGRQTSKRSDLGRHQQSSHHSGALSPSRSVGRPPGPRPHQAMEAERGREGGRGGMRKGVRRRGSYGEPRTLLPVFEVFPTPLPNVVMFVFMIINHFRSKLHHSTRSPVRSQWVKARALLPQAR